MKFLAVAGALISLIPAISGLVINTPTGVVTCQPILLTYGQGTPPYYLSILPGGQVAGTPLHVWDPTNAESMTWIVDIPAGTAISLAVKDSTGAQAYSDTINVQGSADTTCLGGASSANAAAASSSRAAAPAASGTARAPITSAAATTAATHAAVSQSASSNAITGNGAGNSGSTAALNKGRRLSTGSYGFGAAVGLIGALLI
ncbi:hypothetical protein FA13DRAFT_1729326 [Coprinellus micaceus]|uniref:Uncharacterized protein n=1 Tax=Coprinellus micaceus TaxID=71717 RepID=A0A4Y7TKE5_COPMI|nr:hypothetical protein FA13DRAFT_1729326 [Coprinellus micaceus]